MFKALQHFFSANAASCICKKKKKVAFNLSTTGDLFQHERTQTALGLNQCDQFHTEASYK